MSDDDIQSVMVYVDNLCRAERQMLEAYSHTDKPKEPVFQRAIQARAQLINRLKEL